MRVLTTIRRAEYFELNVLFFINAMAMSIWFVPLSAVLDAHGYHAVKPYAFASSAVAAFVSPLLFGAMADRHAAPVVVLRWLAVASAMSMALATTAIKLSASTALVLLLIQLYSLCYVPTFSICTTIVFSRLKNSQREFGPIRAMATFGWMAGCWIVSAIGADTSEWAGYTGAITWLLVAGYTFVLPAVPPPENAERLTLRQRMGWDALTLLKNPDHRVVFITAALFNATVSVLFPYTPPHLRELGFQRTTAWMSLGQVTELIAMFALGGLLLRWRLKWIFVLGLGLAAVRYCLCALNQPYTLLVGLALHGAGFTLVLITSQIYLEQRIDPTWRARAQSLYALMSGGVGNLIGYLGNGAWFALCTHEEKTHWPIFWIGLAAAVTAVLIYFLTAYHGRGTPPKSAAP
ncbi:MAG: MFS transporter [Verrucomicrobiota bacterium]